MTKILLACVIALFAAAFIEGIIIYVKQMEIWHLKNQLWEFSGLEPVFWEDYEEWDG